MNAIQFLKKEHKKIKKLFNQIAKTSYPEKQKKFRGLARYLVVHETMEHKTWYPHFRNGKLLKPLIKNLLKEEKHAAKTIKLLQKLKSENIWTKKFNQFKRDVLSHANHEEKKLFPQVKNALSPRQLVTIGNKMIAFKQNKLKLKVNLIAKHL